MTKAEQELLQEIHRALKGDGLSKEIGIVGKIEKMEIHLDAMETRIEMLEGELKRLRNIVKGVAIGLLIAGVLFGVNSWDAVKALIKSL